MSKLTNLLGRPFKNSDLIPLTITGDTVLFITENQAGDEESVLIGTLASLNLSQSQPTELPLKGPERNITFPPGANRIISSSFIVSTDGGTVSLSIQVDSNDN